MISEEMEQLAKLFDFALTSDNPAVKKALKNLLLLVSIVEPEEHNKTPGPLRQLQDEIMTLRKEIMRLSTDVSVIKERGRKDTNIYTTYPILPHTLTTSGTPSANVTTTVTSYVTQPASQDTIGSLIQEYNLNSKDTNTL
jgi:hypothetical protein